MPMLGFADAPPRPDPEGIEEQEQLEEEPSVADEASDVILSLLPWGVSVLFHAAIVVLTIFLIWAVIEQSTEEEVIIPDVRLSKNPGAPLTMQQMEKVQPSSTQRSVTRATTPSQSQSLTTTVNLQTTLIGVQGASGGKASPFGTQVGQGAGFNANFFGSGGNARTIVFVVDASGSLLDTFPFVIMELKKTVQNLKESQQFTIIFFQENEVIEVRDPRPGLKPATAETKRRVIEWLDPSKHNIVPGGRTDPLPAIRQALKYRPQLMYLLSDNIIAGGTGATMYEIDRGRLLSEIKRANVSGTKINTIQFLYEDPFTARAKEMKQYEPRTLEVIAEQSGGLFKFVDQRELNLE